MVITAGDMLLHIVKSSSCGNITSDGCVPLVTVTLSERITIKAGKKVWHYINEIARHSLSTLVKEVPYSHQCFLLADE